jgi:hypothetical protein
MAEPFTSSRDAARAILAHPAPNLTRRSGQFVGGLAYDRDDEPLTDKQLRWLVDLLKKHDLPALADGGLHE